MNQQHKNTPASEGGHYNMARFGFRMGRSGAHASRTMMLEELKTLLEALPANATKADYVEGVVDANLFSNCIAKARALTSKHLVEFYDLHEIRGGLEG